MPSYDGWLTPYADSIRTMVANGETLKKMARILYEQGARKPDYTENPPQQLEEILVELQSGGRYA